MIATDTGSKYSIGILRIFEIILAGLIVGVLAMFFVYRESADLFDGMLGIGIVAAIISSLAMLRMHRLRYESQDPYLTREESLTEQFSYEIIQFLEVVLASLVLITAGVFFIYRGEATLLDGVLGLVVVTLVISSISVFRMHGKRLSSYESTIDTHDQQLNDLETYREASIKHELNMLFSSCQDTVHHNQEALETQLFDEYNSNPNLEVLLDFDNINGYIRQQMEDRYPGLVHSIERMNVKQQKVEELQNKLNAVFEERFEVIFHGYHGVFWLSRVFLNHEDPSIEEIMQHTRLDRNEAEEFRRNIRLSYEDNTKGLFQGYPPQVWLEYKDFREHLAENYADLDERLSQVNAELTE